MNNKENELEIESIGQAKHYFKKMKEIYHNKLG